MHQVNNNNKVFRNKYLEIDINTIVHIEASSNYSKVKMDNDKIIIKAIVLKCFEKLYAQHFIRVNRKDLVNVEFIDLNLSKDKSHIFLKNGTQIGISRRRRAHVQKKLDEYSRY